MKTGNLDSATVKAIEAQHAHDNELNTFGFWIYLMSDLVIFSVLFATFAVLGHNYAGGEGPDKLFDLPYLFIETMLLLFSSVTYGFAMISVQNNNKKGVLIGLIITALLGLGFIGMELNEFIKLIMESNGPSRSGFLSAFFTLVATHGTHVTFGLIWMAVVIFQLATQGLSYGVRSKLMRLSLFWHFLDVVWVGVFTVVYLFGLA